MDIAIGVVAHTARLTQAQQLANQVNANYISVDDGTLGVEANHRKVWEKLARHNTDWCLVLEDDAQPVDNFTDQLHSTLAVAPSPAVSLYLGHHQHWHWYPARQKRLAEAGAQADQQDACWIMSSDIAHGVAVAIQTEIVADMLNHTQHSKRPIDYAVRQWLRDTGRAYAFSWPSLVDHADWPTLVKHHDKRPRKQPRKAWRVGGRNTWTAEAVS